MNPAMLKKFKLEGKTKYPSSEWNKNNIGSAMRVYDFDTYKQCNLGVPAGKRNNITVVDFDFYTKYDKNGEILINEKTGKRMIYDEENCIFAQKFGNLNEYIDMVDTYTVETASGGYHMYFQYEEDVPHSTGKDGHRIDIINRTYLVGAGSVLKNKNGDVIGEYYQKGNPNKIQKMPQDLKEWLIEQFGENNKKEKKIRHVNDKNIGDDCPYYITDIKEDQLEKILLSHKKKLAEFFVSYSSYLKFTTACKSLNFKNMWNKISKQFPKYDEDNNIEIWNSVKSSHYDYCFDYLVKIIDPKISAYHKYKPAIKDVIVADETINRQYLGKDYFQDGINYVVKSDTGTGKTTSFREYIGRTKKKFISIVSRVSLGEEQYSSFIENDTEVKMYNKLEALDSFDNDDNCIVTIDSIIMLNEIDPSQYILFLDEISSIVEYLITSSTLNKTRSIVYKIFIQLINSCSQIICTDADINDICLTFLQGTTKKIKYINNIHQHNKDVKSFEINDNKLFVEKLLAEEKFLCCCDSKTSAELIYKHFKDDEKCILIVSGVDQYFKFDEYDKIIFSPKIIYGIDSVMKRPVYCYYNEHTINPRSMVQQVARCRNITQLNYMFTKKKFSSNWDDLDDVRNRLYKSNQMAIAYFEVVLDKKITDQYINLLSRYEYNQGCYDTNKFAHFRALLKDRGIVVNDNLVNTYVDIGNELKELKKQKLEDFDPESKSVEEVNKRLKIPEDRIEFFKPLLIDQYIREAHYNTCKYLYFECNELIGDLSLKKKDFDVNKVKSASMKINLIKELKKEAGCNNVFSLEVTNDISEEKQNEFMHKYRTIFRVRDGKNTKDLKTKEHTQRIIIDMMRNVLDNNIIVAKKKKTPDGKQYREYSICKDAVSVHEELYGFRNSKNCVPADELHNLLLNEPN
jgi:hypothetical protein